MTTIEEITAMTSDRKKLRVIIAENLEDPFVRVEMDGQKLVVVGSVTRKKYEPISYFDSTVVNVGSVA